MTLGCMCGSTSVAAIAFAGLRRKIEGRKTVSSSGCWILTTGTDTNGYPQLRVVGTLVRVSRISYEVFKGPIPPGMFVCHSCDVRQCVNPEHLWLGTAAENSQDMASKGRGGKADKRGEKNSNAKLSAADIVAIRASALKATVVAQQYGTSAKNIRRIRSGQRWPHLPFDSSYMAEEDK